MSRVLLGGDGLVEFDWPVNSQFRCLEGEAAIGLSVVVVVDLVEEVDCRSKATGYQELTVIADGENVALPLLIRWESLSDINDYGSVIIQIDLSGQPYHVKSKVPVGYWHDWIVIKSLPNSLNADTKY